MRYSSTAAVFHDYFAIRGGGERLALTLAEGLDCGLVYGYRTPESYPPDMFPDNALDLGLPERFRSSGIRPMALALLFARARKLAAQSDVRIFSGVAAPFAAPPKGAGGRNILYCHTPPRFLYDKRRFFLASAKLPIRMAAAPALAVFEAGYRRAVDRMDVIVANSENTRQRIRHYLGRESTVVHPPIETDRFRWQGQGGYYLSTARLAPLKRVDRIVDAFSRMPDKHLVVASGGSELEALRRRASDAPNIEFRGWVGEEELERLVGNAIATVYVPADEDFGMSPVESMAAGKPVIGVAEGGLVETVADGETGTLLPPAFDVEALVAAVDAMTPEHAARMRAACEGRAARFSRDVFLAKMRSVAAD